MGVEGADREREAAAAAIDLFDGELRYRRYKVADRRFRLRGGPKGQMEAKRSAVLADADGTEGGAADDDLYAEGSGSEEEFDIARGKWAPELEHEFRANTHTHTAVFDDQVFETDVERVWDKGDATGLVFYSDSACVGGI